MFMRTFGKTAAHTALLKRKWNRGGYQLAMRVISLAVAISVLSACSYRVPEHMASLQEAYPSKESHSSTSGLPAESYRKASFDVNYEDVYRAVEVAVTQSGIVLESANKADGVIYGSIKDYKNRYYAIAINKTTRAKTDVTIYVKAQQGCSKESMPMFVFLGVITLGIGFMLMPLAISNNDYCDKISQLHWEKDFDKDIGTKIVDDLLVKIRQNLHAAGAM